MDTATGALATVLATGAEADTVFATGSAGAGASHVSLRFLSRKVFALYQLYAVLPVVQSETSEIMRVIQ